MNYREFFREVTGHPVYRYQARMGEMPWPDLLQIPTGLGKTAAVVVPWLWKRLHRDEATPRRLVYCLPMRVLVEQTKACADEWIDMARPSFLRKGLDPPTVHLLMGGEADNEWIRRPEAPKVLVGTQDMLLSRALMRGYGISRYQWPVDFAFLHNDALWIFDEVQLMGPGVATSAQIEAFRRELGTARPTRSLWMSATLNPSWLSTVDIAAHAPGFASVALSPEDVADSNVRRRLDAPKTLSRAATRLSEDNQKKGASSYSRELASEILQRHRPGTNTLVVLNTVERAQAVFGAFKKEAPDTSLLLVHARFRAADRRQIEEALRSEPGLAGRIIVATQAVEAGVDISGAVLFTELAPWSSMVQRFGRCNRYGEQPGAEVYWIDLDDTAKLALPYDAASLSVARDRLEKLESASPAALPPADSDASVCAVLRRRDLLELFDTDPDLSGFDVDVSAYIRDAKETDVHVFWRDLSGGLDDQPDPTSDELCRVSLGHLARYLGKKVRGRARTPHVWDTLTERWAPFRGNLRPGMVLLLDAALGGYAAALGFSPTATDPVDPVPLIDGGNRPVGYTADPASAQSQFVPLARHLSETEEEAERLCRQLCRGDTHHAVVSAARWHDVGKTHPVFQKTLLAGDASASERGPGPWAKSPSRARHERPYFRHELASMLAWLEVHQEHPSRDLIAYLIAAHHGKVRTGLRALPAEREPDPPFGPRFARGVWEGDELPGFRMLDGQAVPSVRIRLHLMELGEGVQGPSWTARTRTLLAEHGPFRLAWLEALVRVADWRASARCHDRGST